ncbi:ATP-dependent helicase [Rothia nasimurium]|uniref:ATP-dependent helicase n=1 Tax=Rothia nasimurium TaxID=85336 RepID=UPI003BA112FB
MKNTPAEHSATLYLGAPGTGKTQRLLEAAIDFVNQGGAPDRLLVLTPTRVSATRFREAFSTGITATVSTAPVKAWQAYAYDLLRRAQMEGYLPGVDHTPKLLSGPEQDVLIKELLEGHRQGYGTALMWPQDLQEAIETRGFRHEVRDFFDRMAEYDLSADKVAELGELYGRKEWTSLATLYREYRQVRALRAPNAYDPAALIHEAAKALKANPAFLAAERSRYSLILVDDVQEQTPSIYQLLRLLVGPPTAGMGGDTRPATVCLTACTDTVVQGFRGATPHLVGTLPGLFEGGLTTVQLETSWRMAPAIASRWAEVASRLPLTPGAIHLRQLKQPKNHPREEALLPVGDDGALLNPEKAQDHRAAVESHTVETPQHENQLLAQLILEDHLYRGKAYSRSAIIVRNSSQVTRLKRALINLGLPVKTAASLTPVRDEPAARPFLDALGLILHTRTVRAQEEDQAHQEVGETTQPALTTTSSGLTHSEVTDPASQEALTPSPFVEKAGAAWGLGVDTAIALLTSRLGGATTMEIRRLRQRLRANELRSGGSRDSDALLVEALMNPHQLPTQGAGQAARRLAAVLSAGEKALNEPGATAETVLWALWEASGLGPIWRKQYLTGGAGADRAGRDLDAMIGLFESAARYTDQMPGATAEQFLAYIDSQDLPMDTLAERTSYRDALEILTPALAAGRQWDTVYVAGIQDGTWPNTTVRGSLLGTLDLVDAVTGRLTPGTAQNQGHALLERMKANRFDEIRMFSTAVSRASERVVCTAVSSVDEAPSELLDIFAPPEGGERTNTEVRRPMTLRSLIAELRQWAEAQHLSPAKADAAARLLHRLADPESTSGIQLPGAHPSSWWGMLSLSSTAPAFMGEGPVPVSPSQIEKIHKSPLDWFVSAARAEAATDASRSLGTLIHSICEEFPDADGITLRDELRLRLPELGLPDTWESRKTIERAETMVMKFAEYVRELPAKGRRLVGVEGSFSVLVPGPTKDALLSGRVDRIEVDQLGRFVIIDIKTGKSKPSKADIQVHPQLAAYQVALEAGAGEQMSREVSAHQDGAPATSQDRPVLPLHGLQELSGGALLLQIGDSTKSYSEQAQEPLTQESTWAVDLITRAAELIANDFIQARHTGEGTFGVGCTLPEICPLCARGRAITVRPAQ